MTVNPGGRPAPHIRYEESTCTIMGDAILTLLFLYAMAFYYHGPRTVALGGVSAAASILCDVFCILLAGRRPHLRDLSALVTGLIIPLLMPASIPYHIVAAAAVFAIVVVKQPFGGMGYNVFNPAAGGVAFATICFTGQMFLYPQPREWLPVFGETQSALVNGPSFTLALGGIPQYDILDMALGNYPGPMGATNILVILACLLYLILRNTVRWEMPVSFLLTAGVFAWLFPRAGMLPRESVLFEMMSGLLLFGGVFLLGDPVTTPKRDWSKVGYGVTAGIIVMLFRRYGNLQESFVFAVLLMNAAVWAFDMLGERLASLIRRRKFEAFNDQKTQKKV